MPVQKCGEMDRVTGSNLNSKNLSSNKNMEQWKFCAKKLGWWWWWVSNGHSMWSCSCVLYTHFYLLKNCWLQWRSEYWPYKNHSKLDIFAGFWMENPKSKNWTIWVPTCPIFGSPLQLQNSLGWEKFKLVKCLKSSGGSVSGWKSDIEDYLQTKKKRFSTKLNRCRYLLKMSEMIVEECSTVWLTEINFSICNNPNLFD